MARLQSALALLVLVSVASAQWDSCPFGLVNDAYPGECGKYIDTSNDGICDRSQTRPEATVAVSSTKPAVGAATSTTLSSADPPAQQNQPSLWGEYNLLPLSAAVMILYCVTFCLSRIKKISVLSHRRLWNALLLMTFIMCGITGMLIAVRLDLRWDIPVPALMSFWHTETGIAMTIISVFHVIWHWRYFVNMVFSSRSKEPVSAQGQIK